MPFIPLCTRKLSILMADLDQFEFISTESGYKMPLIHSTTYAILFHSFVLVDILLMQWDVANGQSALAIFRDPSQIAITQKYKLLSMYWVKTTQWNGLSLCLTPITMFLVSHVQFNSHFTFLHILVTWIQGGFSVVVVVVCYCCCCYTDFHCLGVNQ